MSVQSVHPIAQALGDIISGYVLDIHLLLLNIDALNTVLIENLRILSVEGA